MSRNKFLDVPGCLHSKLTVWKEEQFTVLPFQGIDQRKKRVAEWVAKALSLAKPGVWGCVKARVQWSTEEDEHIRPGATGCVSLVMLVQFNLDHRKCEDYVLV